MTEKAHDPITRGEILLEEFLIPLGISQYRLAKTIGVPPRRINEIVHGRRRITPETGLRMSRALGLSDRYWLNIQLDYYNAHVLESVLTHLAPELGWR
jgi:antitoxin HigA-1